MKVALISVVIDGFGTIPKGIGKIEKKWTSRDHPDYSITTIGHNTEKNPGELRGLVVTRTPV